MKLGLVISGVNDVVLDRVEAEAKPEIIRRWERAWISERSWNFLLRKH